MTVPAGDDAGVDASAGGSAVHPSHPADDPSPPIPFGAVMDPHRVTRALLDRAPRLASPLRRLGEDEDHTRDLAALAAAVATAWADNTTSTGPGGVGGDAAAVRAVVDAAWRWAYRAGAQVGHGVVSGYVAVSALDAAEPARVDMSDGHRDVANLLQAARVPTTALRRYLTASGARPTGTWRGGDLLRLSSPIGFADVLVPRPGVRDHPHRIVDAAIQIAHSEDRSVAAVLADLAAPPHRPPLSHAALRYLWRVYETATEVGSALVRDDVPGPARRHYAAALVDTADDTDLDRLVMAILVGHDHGMRYGHADGARSASAAILSQLRDGDVTIQIGDRTAIDWVEVVDAHARYTATIAQRFNDGLAGHPRGGAFPPLHSIDPNLSADGNPSPRAAPPVPPAPHR